MVGEQKCYRGDELGGEQKCYSCDEWVEKQSVAEVNRE